MASRDLNSDFIPDEQIAVYFEIWSNAVVSIHLNDKSKDILSETKLSFYFLFEIMDRATEISSFCRIE